MKRILTAVLALLIGLSVLSEGSIAVFADSGNGSVIITFNANGGTGGSSNSMITGDPLAAPSVSRTGYILTGWSPAVPAVVPAADTTYTAQWVHESADNLAVDINLEAGRYTGGIFTPLIPGEALRANDVITVRIAPESDFLCGITRYVVMFSKNYFEVVGSGKAAFTPNTANTFYAAVCSDYNGAVSIPESAWPAVLVTDGTYAANSAVSVNNSAGPTAPNGGYPGYLPGEWLFRFDLKVTQDIPDGSGAKVWMDNQWLRTPGYTTGQMYFHKCLDPAQISTNGSSTAYYFNVDLTGANISLEPGNVNLTFDANGGTGGTTVSMAPGSALIPPAVARTGFVLAGWSPALPAKAGAVDATYSALWRLLGDMNGNGSITSADALMALQTSAELIIPTEVQRLAADVNRSGTVTSADALKILQYSAGIITSF